MSEADRPLHRVQLTRKPIVLRRDSATTVALRTLQAAAAKAPLRLRLSGNYSFGPDKRHAMT